MLCHESKVCLRFTDEWYIVSWTNEKMLSSLLSELAKGGCMSEFRWNSGGNFNGKPWDENLPTDAMVNCSRVIAYVSFYLVRTE